MNIREVLRTCSNAHVARAALISIGGDLAASAASEARHQGKPLGEFVSGMARDFETTAGTGVWARAEEAMHDAEQPVLAGFSVVVAHGLVKRNSKRVRRHRELMVA